MALSSMWLPPPSRSIAFAFNECHAGSQDRLVLHPHQLLQLDEALRHDQTEFIG